VELSLLLVKQALKIYSSDFVQVDFSVPSSENCPHRKEKIYDVDFKMNTTPVLNADFFGCL